MSIRERRADRKQTQTQTQTHADILYGLPRHSVNDKMTCSRKHSNRRPKDMPHALPPSLGRAGSRSLVSRQTGREQSRAGRRLRLPLVLLDRAEWKQEGLREQRRPQPEKTLGMGPEAWSPAPSLRTRRWRAESTRGHTVRGASPLTFNSTPAPDQSCLGNETKKRTEMSGNQLDLPH